MLNQSWIIMGSCTAALFFNTSVVGQGLPPGATLLDGGINKESIPMREAVWAVFMTVVSAEQTSPGAGTGHLQGLGLDESSADALFRYIRASVDSKNLSDVARRQNFCSRRDQISRRDDLVRELNDTELAADAEREKYIAGLFGVLNADNHQRILRHAEALRSGMTILTMDAATHFAAATDNEVDAAVSRRCDTPATSGPIAQ